ncbi:MAG: hypothetical protein KatS3mg051_1926 [Anaerolineae bacterium]|nr:MAG: hypothetical protein KatS3mg051_1926 [Anaerolineae bacterium]
MNKYDFQNWCRDNAATLSVGSVLLPFGERIAVIAATADFLLAAVPGREASAVYEQTWEWQASVWKTRHVGDLPAADNVDALYDLLTAPCPRCDGSGVVWVAETNEAGNHALVDVPCPECTR